MRCVLSHEEFAVWLARFLPAIPADGSAGWLGSFAVYLLGGTGRPAS